MLKTLAFLPGLNILEMVWADIKMYINKKTPKTIYDLAKFVL